MLNAVAWMILTTQDPTVRDGKLALEMATKACDLTKYKNVDYLDTLATANAECSDRGATLKWSQAILELPPGNYTSQYYNALRLSWCNDLDQYRRVCAAMIKQYAAATDNDTKFWVAWTCSLRPAAVEDFSVPRKFADEIVISKPTDASFLSVVGMVNYRSGQFEEAAKRSTAAIAACKSDKSGKTSPLYSQFFLAMADSQLGKKDEARHVLKVAQAEMDQDMKSPPSWNRRATLEQFHHEAEALIGSADAEPSEAKKPASPPQK
jgi:tetratricopeptide (TPR) repeat protein